VSSSVTHHLAYRRGVFHGKPELANSPSLTSPGSFISWLTGDPNFDPLIFVQKVLYPSSHFPSLYCLSFILVSRRSAVRRTRRKQIRIGTEVIIV